MRRRQRDPEPRQPGASGDEGAAPAASELRDRAERLLATGDDIIERALSGDSERFLRENRQQGGQ